MGSTPPERLCLCRCGIFVRYTASHTNPRVVGIEGIVRAEPTVGASGKARFVVEATRIEMDGQIINLPCDILAIVPAVTPTLEDAVRVIGSLRPIAPPRNPGQFNARRVMELRGITCELAATSAMDLEITAPARGFSLPRLAAACRKWRPVRAAARRTTQTPR